MRRKLEVKYLDLSVLLVRWEVGVLCLKVFALGQKGLSTIHNNPWELRRNPSTPVPVREFLSRSWIRADCGSRLPIIPVIELRGSQIKAHNTHMCQIVSQCWSHCCGLLHYNWNWTESAKY